MYNVEFIKQILIYETRIPYISNDGRTLVKLQTKGTFPNLSFSLWAIFQQHMLTTNISYLWNYIWKQTPYSLSEWNSSFFHWGMPHTLATQYARDVVNQITFNIDTDIWDWPFFGWYDHKKGLFDIKGQFIDLKPDRNFLQLFIKYIL